MAFFFLLNLICSSFFLASGAILNTDLADRVKDIYQISRMSILKVDVRSATDAITLHRFVRELNVNKTFHRSVRSNTRVSSRDHADLVEIGPDSILCL